MSAGGPTAPARSSGHPRPGSLGCPLVSPGAAELARGGAACSVVDTTELRWFASGPLPPGIRDGMTRENGVTEQRCDSYLVDDRDGVGVKLRARTTLELKVRQSLGEWIDLGDGLAGVPEQWRKWSPIDDLVGINSSSQWIDVHKTVIKRRFSINGNEVPFLDGPTADMSGCDVEVAQVDVDDRSMWTVAFAAFGPPADRRAVLVASWRALAVDLARPALLRSLDDRTMSYPDWLARIRPHLR